MSPYSPPAGLSVIVVRKSDPSAATFLLPGTAEIHALEGTVWHHPGSGTVAMFSQTDRGVFRLISLGGDSPGNRYSYSPGNRYSDRDGEALLRDLHKEWVPVNATVTITPNPRRAK